MVNYKPALRNLLLVSFQRFKLLEGYSFFFPTDISPLPPTHTHAKTDTL